MLAMSPEQQFLAFADAIAAIPDASQRASAAMGVFGKSAGELLPLLNEGADGIAKMQQEAIDLGLQMSGDTAESAAKAADSLDALFAVVKATAVQVGSAFAPALTIAVKVLSSLLGASKDYIAVAIQVAAAVGAAIFVMKAYTAATRSQINAQAILTALSGPKGIILLAAGFTAATIAVSRLNQQQREQNAELERIQKNAPAAGDALAKSMPKPTTQKTAFQAYAEDLAGLQANFEKVNSESAQGQADAFALQMNKLTHAFETLDKFSETSMSPEQFATYKQAAIDAFTGVADKTKELQTELAILRGETTAQEQQFAAMAVAGASNAQLDMLRAMTAEREKLLALQSEEQKRQADIAAETEKSRASVEAEVAAIKESIKTPRQKVMERIDRLKELEKQGSLNLLEAAVAIGQAQDELKKIDAEGKPTTPIISQEPRFAGAAMRGGAEAFSTILKSMGRKDPNVAATEKQTQQLVAALENNKPEFQVAEAG
jgi:biotin operon repressor